MKGLLSLVGGEEGKEGDVGGGVCGPGGGVDGCSGGVR